MGRLITVAIFVASLCLATIAHAAFRIELKDGKEFVTDQYWEEGNQIKFNYYGGVVGVEKDTVGKIEKTNLPAKTASETARAPEETRAKEKADEVDIDSYREKRAELKRKFEEASERYRAANRSQDVTGREKAREEMREFSRQAYDLADEVKEKNKGILPEWWEESR